MNATRKDTAFADRGPGPLALLGVATLAGCFALALGSAPRAAFSLDEVDYERVVDILGVTPVKGADGRFGVDIQFNLNANVPKGAVIEFELVYQALPFDFYQYTLKDENRKNLKLSWKPKSRLPIDTYNLRTRMPLANQTAVVVKELEAREKVFPKASAPWSWNYPDLPVKIGTDEDLAAEDKAIKEHFKETLGQLIASNNKFMVEIEALNKGEKYVKNGKVVTEEVTKFVEDWMKKHGEMQLALQEYEKKEPGLFRKSERAHFELQDLGRMIAKRCYSRELKTALDKHKVAVVDLKLKGDPNFDPNFRYNVSAESLGNKYRVIASLVGLEG